MSKHTKLAIVGGILAILSGIISIAVVIKERGQKALLGPSVHRYYTVQARVIKDGKLLEVVAGPQPIATIPYLGRIMVKDPDDNQWIAAFICLPTIVKKGDRVQVRTCIQPHEDGNKYQYMQFVVSDPNASPLR